MHGKEGLLTNFPKFHGDRATSTMFSLALLQNLPDRSCIISATIFFRAFYFALHRTTLYVLTLLRLSVFKKNSYSSMSCKWCIVPYIKEKNIFFVENSVLNHFFCSTTFFKKIINHEEKKLILANF